MFKLQILEVVYSSRLEVVGIGSGTGAKLRAVIENQKVNDVVVLNTGIGYTSATTSIKVNQRF